MKKSLLLAAFALGIILISGKKEAKYVSLARENINKEESQLRLNF